MLFRLYNIYCRYLAELSAQSASGETFKPLPFDRFASWGEVLLGDFSEVDQYMVDAELIFSNVRDFREISANFLSDEQREMIERFFGYSPALESVEGFWKHVGPEEERGKLRARFLELWQLLPELYERLRADLEQDDLCMPGSAFRLAVEEVRGRGEEALPWEKVVFVGFNALSTSENLLFEELSKYQSEDGTPYAEFFWDGTGPVLSGEHGAATRELKRNRTNFPSPEWAAPYIARSEASSMPPSIVISASPSNAAQTKIAGAKISELLRRIDESDIRDARVAVVLPDENLLLPLLYSLPKELESVNLTMGHSLRFTSVASFVYHIRRLYQRRREADGQEAYFHEDIRLFLAHPLTHVAIGSDAANKMAGKIAESHAFTVTVEDMREVSPALADLLTPLSHDANPEQTVAWLDGILETIDRALVEGDAGAEVKKRLERSQILVYRNALSQLLDAIREHGIAMGPESVLHLADRLLAGEKVTFKGEPLKGLQVMGILETRALDFDHVIVLSMNDKIMPRSGSRRTFIPDSLRRGYGLPLSRHAESLYSYYFYRMISRARGVDLIYDARAGEGMRSGGKSRFLLQLELLHGGDSVRNETFTYRLNDSSSKPKPIEKTKEVMEELRAYTVPESKMNLSASALMDYCKCQVRFYYKDVKKIVDDETPRNFINAATQGDIVHAVMLGLYLPEEDHKKFLSPPRVVPASRISQLADDLPRLRRLVAREINRNHFKLGEDSLDRPLPEGVAMVAEHLVEMIRDIMHYDASRGDLHIVGGEMKGRTRLKVGEAPEVNVSYAFDRVDLKEEGSYRIVDYKTGTVKLKANEPSNIFDGSYDAKNILQLLLYSALLSEKVGAEARIEPVIYDAAEIDENGESRAIVAKTEVRDYNQVKDEFLEGLAEKLEELFDPERPLVPADDDKVCSNCRLQALCGRV